MARIRKYIPLIVPVFMMAIRSADNLAMALESKAFGAARKRSSLEEYVFRGVDAIALLGSIAVFVVSLIIRIQGYGGI